MKIGILTLLPSSNYGGILQAAAMNHTLKLLGHEAILINKKHHTPCWKSIAFSIFKHLPFQNFKNIRSNYIKSKRLSGFISTHLPPKTDTVISPEDLRHIVSKEKFDVVLVGSDQVWRYTYINDGFYSVYFLDFKRPHKLRKISYAASFGTSTWEAPEKNEEIIRLLSDFDSISVREAAGISLCSNLFHAKAEHNIDPTLLAGRNFYDQILNEKKGTGGLVSYILDAEKIKSDAIIFIMEKFRKQGHHIVQTNLSNKSPSGQFYSIEEWLLEIKFADYVITDSFHGMIFSILFSRQFVVFANKSRGLSRFTEFLSPLGIEDRMVTDCNSAYLKLSEKIDYKIIQEKIEIFRMRSLSYLKKSIADTVQCTPVFIR